MNKHSGSSFDDYLKEEGIQNEVYAGAYKQMFARQIKKAMKQQKISMKEMAQELNTSRSQINRILDPDNEATRVESLVKIANAVGGHVEINLVFR